MTSEGVRQVRLGPEHPRSWWNAHSPDGDCPERGGQCDGDECGLHAAGCVFGGSALLYWMIAEDCPLFHGEEAAR